jgi:hypothetical protein
VVGFSGTNDNHRLLPLQVHQAQLDEPMLQATNGKMVHVILNHTKGCSTLELQVDNMSACQPSPHWVFSTDALHRYAAFC